MLITGAMFPSLNLIDKQCEIGFGVVCGPIGSDEEKMADAKVIMLNYFDRFLLLKKIISGYS